MKLLALLALLSPAAHAEECEGFTFVLERDGARVFNRKVEGSGVRELCATIRLAAPPAQIYDLLRDVERYPQRMPPTVQVERVASQLEPVPGEASYYMVIDPGFIDRRDYCVSTQGQRDGSAWVIQWRMVACPMRKILRMVTNRGSWRISPDGPDGTRSAIVYHTHADPGGLVPAWLVNAASARRVPEILNAVKRALDDKVSRR